MLLGVWAPGGLAGPRRVKETDRRKTRPVQSPRRFWRAQERAESVLLARVARARAGPVKVKRRNGGLIAGAALVKKSRGAPP